MRFVFDLIGAFSQIVTVNMVIHDSQCDCYINHTMTKVVLFLLESVSLYRFIKIDGLPAFVL